VSREGGGEAQLRESIDEERETVERRVVAV
jgi:hypothetical protein